MNNKAKIAWKPQNYEARVASVRIRCLNTLRELRAERFPIELYRERHEASYRAVVFSKAYSSKDIAIAERLKQQGVKVVFDICDNHFLLKNDRVVRLKRMFELADHWVVSSHALARVVRQNLGNEKPLTVIEDAVEQSLSGNWFDISSCLKAHWQLHTLRRFLRDPALVDAAHLVWFGNHKASYQNSGIAHVTKLRSLFEKIHASTPITLTIISNSKPAFDDVFVDWQLPLFYMDWSAHTFFTAMRRHSIAVIPIEVNEFTEVKTNNRIAQSLFLGLGVVADSIESYQVFADCAYLDRWEQGLHAYIENPVAIAQHISDASAILQQKFSVPVIAGRWKALLESL
ncbi:MAG: hypothetical protein ACR2P1_01730 [Pseudomonadales bacterium]